MYLWRAATALLQLWACIRVIEGPICVFQSYKHSIFCFVRKITAESYIEAMKSYGILKASFNMSMMLIG